MGFWVGVADYFKDADQRRHEREMYLQKMRDTMMQQRFPQMRKWAEEAREATNRLAGIKSYWSSRLEGDLTPEEKAATMNILTSNFEQEENIRRVVEVVEAKEGIRITGKPLLEFMNLYENMRQEGEDRDAFNARWAYSVVPDDENNLNIAKTMENFLDPSKEYSAADWEMFINTPVHEDDPRVVITPNFSAMPKNTDQEPLDLADASRVTDAVYANISGRLNTQREKLNLWLQQNEGNPQAQNRVAKYHRQLEQIDSILSMEYDTVDKRAAIIDHTYSMGGEYANIVWDTVEQIGKDFNIPNPWSAPGLANIQRPSIERPKPAPGRGSLIIGLPPTPAVEEEVVLTPPSMRDNSRQPSQPRQATSVPSYQRYGAMIFMTREAAEREVVQVKAAGRNATIRQTPDGRFEVVVE